MNEGSAERFRPAIDRKLAAEGISTDDDKEAIAALSKCIMGARLVEAYKVIYGAEK